MLYGCIGEKLGHSFSKEIHTALSPNSYELCEVAKDALDAFMRRADFKAINVTIPYKQDVIPYLSYIDESAKSIGAVNTIVNRDGKLYGYNTDFFGMTALIKKTGIEVGGKKCVILGTGGTCKTAYAVLHALGAKEVVKVGREKREGVTDYEALYREHTDTEIFVNTTPLGMYPRLDASAVELSKFTKVCGVIDAVYNPLRTRLVSDARALGITAEGGLYMLVAQGVRASEIFLDVKYPDGTLDRVYKKLLSGKENVVLTGMPGSGKSTVGKIIAEELGLEFFDTDTVIEEKTGKKIPDIIREEGEAAFRLYESEAIKKVAMHSGRVIATGGGAVLKAENVYALKQNGRIFFIDRPPESLVPTSDRPLSSTKEAIMKRYEERYGIYTSTADHVINADKDERDTVDKILSEVKV